MRITGFNAPCVDPQAIPNAATVHGARENFTLTDPFGNPRTLRVYLPPGYDADSRKKFPLLLMQDGQNLFEDATSYTKVSWRLGVAIAEGVNDGLLKPMIAVGIDNAYSHEGRAWDYTPWPDDEHKVGGGADQYLDWIESAVLPELEQRYRLAQGRENRLIGGSSLGAIVSLYALAKKSALFGGAMLMSGSWFWQKESLHDWVRANAGAFAGARAWLDVGDQEGNAESAQDMRNTLIAAGFREPDTLGFHIAPGGRHFEASWAERVHLPLGYFFGQK